MFRRIAFLATIWIVAGCTASSDPAGASPDRSIGADPSAGASPVVKPTLRPSVAPSAGAAGGVVDLPPSILDPVVDEIARLAGVPRGDVTVVTAEGVTFPNGALGCPKPGMAYTQVQVDGYRIVAVAGATTYDFRGTGAGVFRRCS